MAADYGRYGFNSEAQGVGEGAIQIKAAWPYTSDMPLEELAIVNESSVTPPANRNNRQSADVERHDTAMHNRHRIGRLTRQQSSHILLAVNFVLPLLQDL